MGRKIYMSGLNALIKLKPDAKTVAAAAALIASLFSLYAAIKTFLGSYVYTNLICLESCAVIITMILLCSAVEEKTSKRAGEPIEKLSGLFPKTAAIVIDDDEKVCDIADLAAGDSVLVRPGESLPCDGIITSGRASISEAMLTGENSPVVRKIGDRVFAGTLNTFGTVTVKAERVGEETELARMINSVSGFRQSKKRAVSAGKSTEIFISWVALTLGLLSFILWLTLYKDVEIAIRTLLGILTVACPCAIGLASPAAAPFAAEKCSQEGVVFKDIEALERLGSINTAVMDKTGTVTVGRPFVTDVVPLGASWEEVIMLAASLMKDSVHPASLAVNDYASKNDIYPVECQRPPMVGQGYIKSSIEDSEVTASSSWEAFTGEYEGYRAVPKELEDSGKQVIAITKNGTPIGIIALADRLKPTSKAAVAMLTRLGIRSVMVTGDSDCEAARIASQAGFYDYAAEVSPDKKGKYIMMLKKNGSRVAMVGDSINDAVALAAADVGAAMGTGSNIAIEGSMVVLLRNDLRDFASGVRISRAVKRIIKENVFWAVIYNLIALPFAAGIFFALTKRPLSPAAAILCLLLSVVSMIINSKRILMLDLTREDDLGKKSVGKDD